MYLKAILAQILSKFKLNIINVSDENDDDESNNSENLSDVDENMPLFKRDFY
jgi:hypothetical protein